MSLRLDVAPEAGPLLSIRYPSEDIPIRAARSRTDCLGEYGVVVIVVVTVNLRRIRMQESLVAGYERPHVPVDVLTDACINIEDRPQQIFVVAHGPV